MIPLKFDDVIVGYVELTESQKLNVRIIYPDAEVYLKELIAHGYLTGISFSPEFAEFVTNSHIAEMQSMDLVEGH